MFDVPCVEGESKIILPRVGCQFWSYPGWGMVSGGKTFGFSAGVGRKFLTRSSKGGGRLFINDRFAPFTLGSGMRSQIAADRLAAAHREVSQCLVEQCLLLSPSRLFSRRHGARGVGRRVQLYRQRQRQQRERAAWHQQRCCVDRRSFWQCQQRVLVQWKRAN